MNRPHVPPPVEPFLPNASLAAAKAEPAELSSRRQDALLPGTRLEEFELEKVIGASGFGLVYLARDEAFDRHVAIKEYFPDTLAMRENSTSQVMLRANSHAEAFERGRRAFIEEAALLSRCNHPSLLHVMRSWEANGTVYRVMPHYPGSSLLALRRAMESPPDEASLRALMDGLLAALEVLHGASAIHREITPHNILLRPDDRPVLMDFGAARRAIVGDQARALMTMLEPSFAPIELTSPSPERSQGPWTDLYSLAAVVKYCVSGQLPEPASLLAPPVQEPMGQVAQRVERSFAHLRYTPSFINAIDAALAIRPNDRPQSVAQFRAMLDNHPVALGEPAGAGRTRAPIDWGKASDSERRASPPSVEPSAASAPGLARAAAVADAGVASKPATVPPVSATPDTLPRLDNVAIPASPDVAPSAVRASADSLTSSPTTPMPPPIKSAAGAARPREPSFEPPPMFRLGGDTLDNIPSTTPMAYQPQGHRSRRGLVWGICALVVLAVGGGAWLVDQQLLTQAQSAFARAARKDGLTANVPAVPKAPEAPAAVSARSEAPAAQASAAAEDAPLPEAPTAAVKPSTAAATTMPPANVDVDTPEVTTAPSSTAATASTAVSPAAPPAASAAPEPEVAAAEKPSAATLAERQALGRPRGADRSPAAPNHSSHPVQGATAHVAAAPAAVRGPTSPREVCGERTQFSLYRCMQTQCEVDKWSQHPQCQHLRARDEVE